MFAPHFADLCKRMHVVQVYCNQCMLKQLKKKYVGLPERDCWQETVAKICSPVKSKRCTEFFEFTCPVKRFTELKTCLQCIQTEVTDLEKTACPQAVQTHCNPFAKTKQSGVRPGMVKKPLAIPSWMHPPVPGPTPKPSMWPTKAPSDPSSPASHAHVSAASSLSLKATMLFLFVLHRGWRAGRRGGRALGRHGPGSTC